MQELQWHPDTAKILEAIDTSAGKQIGKDVHCLEPDENLFDLGLTSIGFISMVVEFEQRFGIFFEEDELELANFNTLAAIHAELLRKLSQRQPAGQA